MRPAPSSFSSSVKTASPEARDSNTISQTSKPDRFAHFFSDGFNEGFQILAHLLLFSIAWRWRSWRPVQLDVGVTLLAMRRFQRARLILE